MVEHAQRTAPLTVALAGAGMISHYHLNAWRKLGDRVRIAAIADPDRARAAQRAAEFGIPAIHDGAAALFAADRIDALDVLSPRETHAAWVEVAAARGIAVLCQKPMTPTLAQSQALVRAVDAKTRLMIHENWRFRPWYCELRRWIEAGALGDIAMARLSMINSGLLPDRAGRRFALERQPFFRDEPRLLIAEGLIHQIDTVRYLCGPLRVVAARAARTVPDVVGETCADIFMETASGAPVTVTGNIAAPGYPPRTPDRLEIVGSRASAVFQDDELALLGPAPRRQRYDRDAGYQASFDAVIAHFIDCLESGARFETDPADNLETLTLVEHAYWAAGLANVPATRADAPRASTPA
jgi:predicted dehydrogenase